MDINHFVDFTERFVTPDHYRIAKRYSQEFHKEEMGLESIASGEAKDIVSSIVHMGLMFVLANFSSKMHNIFAEDASDSWDPDEVDESVKHYALGGKMGSLSALTEDSATIVVNRYNQIAGYAMEAAGSRDPGIVVPKLVDTEFRYEVTRKAFGNYDNAVAAFDIYQEFKLALAEAVADSQVRLKEIVPADIRVGSLPSIGKIKKGLVEHRERRVKVYKKIFDVKD